MVRLSEDHELRGNLERASARGARCVGVPPAGHGTPNSCRTEASLSPAVSPAYGASLPYSPRRHRAFLSCVVLWFAVRAGKTCEWHALSADGAWGLSTGAISESEIGRASCRERV